MLAGLSSTYDRAFDGGVHTDFIASIAPNGTRKENRKMNAKGTEKGKQRLIGRGEDRFTKIPPTGGGSTAASADTAPPKGMEQVIQITKKKKKHKVVTEG